MTAESSTIVGLLHPGDMGAAVGATVVAGGARVLWASAGRSAATRARAREVGLEDAGTLASVVRASRVILSVVPPHGAADLARAVAALGFGGLYVDANAVAPATAREIGRVVEAAGARFVDGGIIGPATRSRRGATRVYLSGPAATEIAPLFAAGPLEAVVLDAPAGAASAVKMAYAGWNKGGQALLAAIRAFAIAEGVDAALLAEWKISQPDVPGRSERAVHDNARKAWRFVGEMEEIARSLAAVGLPPAFHEAAREIYARLADYKDTTTPPTMEEAARALRSRGPARVP
ncbi:MAG: NAD(P)-dependent oxidoreductase [Candidatus Rokuibacteriota bacterium]|nr:MAG: NAD(P)-dependent oxidoreductase [Candidatus Rokubacteria bacterium]